eukprot:TRINITY_DN71466_c0_g1_i1.p1 TRINITY_DN71466_c0_g1~~TRINITY_DN71466_c0_g1_i1.p1  ORF type:complete len:428 (+),score=97.63 TRINITY_DN71466_c0_g1_i1:57-1286(+)
MFASCVRHPQGGGGPPQAGGAPPQRPRQPRAADGRALLPEGPAACVLSFLPREEALQLRLAGKRWLPAEAFDAVARCELLRRFPGAERFARGGAADVPQGDRVPLMLPRALTVLAGLSYDRRCLCQRRRVELASAEPLERGLVELSRDLAFSACSARLRQALAEHIVTTSSIPWEGPSGACQEPLSEEAAAEAAALVSGSQFNGHVGRDSGAGADEVCADLVLRALDCRSTVQLELRALCADGEEQPAAELQVSVSPLHPDESLALTSVSDPLARPGQWYAELGQRRAAREVGAVAERAVSHSFSVSLDGSDDGGGLGEGRTSLHLILGYRHLTPGQLWALIVLCIDPPKVEAALSRLRAGELGPVIALRNCRGDGHPAPAPVCEAQAQWGYDLLRRACAPGGLRTAVM